MGGVCGVWCVSVWVWIGVGGWMHMRVCSQVCIRMCLTLVIGHPQSCCYNYVC